MALGAAFAVAGPRERRRIDASTERPRLPRTDEVAWIALLPCVAIVVTAIVVLGPSVGRIAFPQSGLTFWPSVIQRGEVSPEPTEQGRYLVALAGPLLLTAAIAFGTCRVRPLRPINIKRLVFATQLIALAFLLGCIVVQYRYTFHLTAITASEHTVYFKPPTLVVAVALAIALAAGVGNPGVRRRFAALTRESASRGVAMTAIAALAITLWLLPAVNFEKTIVNANEIVTNHLPYWLDETFAVLDGRFPLVDFAAQYGSLWQYPIAGTMALLGSSIGVFTVAMCIISAAAMLATFATLRRLIGSSIMALLLFLPFLATSFFMMEGPLDNRYAIDNLFGTFPLRYAGPLILLWLAARHLAGNWPRRATWLFGMAGLVVLNNGEFGIPALGATIAALLWAAGRPTRAALGALMLEAVAGLVCAYALVSVLTLGTAGSLPHLGLLFRYSRLFALGGFGLLPMTPTIGMSTIIYLTYVAAIGTATARAVSQERDRLLTGLLAWSGVFGLGIGSYYMGRSHPEVLTNMFCAWALSVTLLLVLTIRSIAARGARRPTIAQVACLFAFGVLVCSVAQMPTPWSQIARLRHTGLTIYSPPEGEQFVALHSHRGEAVAILTLLGHRIGYDLGLVDVTAYTGLRSMPTADQLDETLADLRAAGGRTVFLLAEETWQEVPGALASDGYKLVARERYGMTEFSRQEG